MPSFTRRKLSLTTSGGVYRKYKGPFRRSNPQHLLWWPLHPLGFAVAANHLMDKIWFSIFIARAIKKLVLRFAWPATYTSVRFFLGLIMGETLCNGLWVVIDYFTGKTGNIIFILG